MWFQRDTKRNTVTFGGSILNHPPSFFGCHSGAFRQKVLKVRPKVNGMKPIQTSGTHLFFAKPKKDTSCGWAKSVRTTWKPWSKPLSMGIYRQFIIPGFLRWCRVSSIHSMTVRTIISTMATPFAADFWAMHASIHQTLAARNWALRSPAKSLSSSRLNTEIHPLNTKNYLSSEVEPDGWEPLSTTNPMIESYGSAFLNIPLLVGSGKPHRQDLRS